jgi:hypothetical protein
MLMKLMLAASRLLPHLPSAIICKFSVVFLVSIISESCLVVSFSSGKKSSTQTLHMSALCMDCRPIITVADVRMLLLHVLGNVSAASGDYQPLALNGLLQVPVLEQVFRSCSELRTIPEVMMPGPLLLLEYYSL